MQDLQSLHGQMQLPRRYNIRRRGQIHTLQFLKSIARPDKTDAENADAPQDQQMHDLSEYEEQERGDEVIYSGDMNMIIDIDTIPQLAQKLLNYGTLTATRDVEIHWGNVGIIARPKENSELKAKMSRPFNLERIETTGKVLGKYIQTNLTR